MPCVTCEHHCSGKGGCHQSGRSSTEIAAKLHRHRIAIGNGDFWARRCITALGLTPEDGVVRVGIAHYNSAGDIDRLIKALDEALG